MHERGGHAAARTAPATVRAVPVGTTGRSSIEKRCPVEQTNKIRHDSLCRAVPIMLSCRMANLHQLVKLDKEKEAA